MAIAQIVQLILMFVLDVKNPMLSFLMVVVNATYVMISTVDLVI